MGSTGLGMAITKNIVQMMNGDILVESEKGVGTTFTVMVTLKTTDRSTGGGESLPRDLRLLVVDDDEVACEHAQLVARSLDLQAEYVRDAETALARVRAEREAGRPFHVVLTDYRMPGMDGIEFTRALRAFDGGETAVIILTGYSWAEIREEAAEAGVDGIMSKPVFKDSLLNEIRHVLLRRSSADGAGAVPALPEDEPRHRLQGSHVLIAEDIDINAEILMDLLEMEEITSDHAENGQEALDLFSQSAENTYTAVLMDVRMPVMDGLEAACAIRALDRGDAKTVPIVAMTANAFDEDVQRSLQAGMNAHLSKPVDPDRLYETLDRLVFGEREPE